MKKEKVILIAEDDADDIFMMERAIKMLNTAVAIHFVKDGQEAIEYLSGVDKYADRTPFPLPSLILLDNKMPRKNGLEVLEWLKRDEALASIPVVMLTSSRMPNDISKARNLGAKAYLVKPMESDKLKQMLTAPEEFLATYTA